VRPRDVARAAIRVIIRADPQAAAGIAADPDEEREIRHRPPPANHGARRP
jgi:hypothetical protein